MSDVIKIPKVKPLPTLTAILRQIEREKLRDLITDAERNHVFAGKTEAEQLLLLGEIMDKKGIPYKK